MPLSRLSRKWELQPGLHWTRSDYAYREWRHPLGSPENLGSRESVHRGSQWLMPCVTLAWRPSPRLHGSLGAGYAAVIPGHVLDFDDGRPDWAKRLGLHAQAGFGIF